MAPSERPLAKDVSDAFVEQYYLVMKKFPDKLHKFYGGNSTITRLGHDGMMRNSSFSDIGESLNPLSSGGFDSVVVTSIICQACTGGCVMVIVSGYFILNESVEKKFIQTFLLAPGPEPEENPFVFTDLLVFVDKPEANDGTKVDSKASTPPANNETEITRSEVAGDELKDAPKLSYASAVMKETPETQTQKHSNPSPRREAEAVVERGDRDTRDWHGIVIQNLHPNTTKTMIHNAFQQFGEIARVLDRWHPAHRLVMFIEPDAVRKAIEASPIMIDGRQVTVEKYLHRRDRISGDRRTRGRGTRGRGTEGQRW